MCHILGASTDGQFRDPTQIWQWKPMFAWPYLQQSARFNTPTADRYCIIWAHTRENDCELVQNTSLTGYLMNYVSESWQGSPWVDPKIIVAINISSSQSTGQNLSQAVHLLTQPLLCWMWNIFQQLLTLWIVNHIDKASEHHLQTGGHQ